MQTLSQPMVQTEFYCEPLPHGLIKITAKRNNKKAYEIVGCSYQDQKWLLTLTSFLEDKVRV